MNSEENISTAKVIPSDPALQSLIDKRNGIADQVLIEAFGPPLAIEIIQKFDDAVTQFMNTSGHAVSEAGHEEKTEGIAIVSHGNKGAHYVVIHDMPDGTRNIELRHAFLYSEGEGGKSFWLDIDYSATRSIGKSSYTTSAGIYRGVDTLFKEKLETSGVDFTSLSEASTKAFFGQKQQIPSDYLVDRPFHEKDLPFLEKIQDILTTGSPSSRQEASSLFFDVSEWITEVSSPTSFEHTQQQISSQ